MRLFKKQYIAPLKRKGIFIPLALSSLWIIGFYSPVGSEYIYSTRWAVSIVIGLIAMLTILYKHKIKINSMTIAFIVMVMLMFLSSYYSFAPSYTVLRSFSAALLIISTYFVAVSLINNELDIIRAFYALLFLYFISSLIIIGSGFDSANIRAADRYQGSEQLKATGTGYLIVLSVIFLFWMHRFAIQPYRFLIFIIILVLAIILIATRSRLPIAGALMIWPIVWITVRGAKITKAMLSLTLTLILFSILLVSSPDIADYLRVGDKYLSDPNIDISSGRFDRWEILVNESIKRPLLGYGFGTSRYAFWRLISPDSTSQFDWDPSLNTSVFQVMSHNQHVQLFYELGIIGVFLFWIIIFNILKTGIQSFQFKTTPISLMLKLVFLSIIFQLLNTFSHDGLFSTGNQFSYVFWFQVGFLIKGHQIFKKNKAHLKRISLINQS